MKKKQNDLWIYILLQSTLLIFIESLKTYNVNILGNPISLSIPVLPFIFYISNCIIKKYGYKYGLLNILISSLSVILFIVLMSFSLNKVYDFSTYKGELFAYIGSQLFNITIFKYIHNNTSKSYPIIYLSYIFSLIMFHMIYTLSYLDTTILDGYWKKYFINIILQIIVCIPITIAHKKTIK